MTAEEQEQILQVLCSERFADCAPGQVYAALLDEHQYLCSWRTMYRILKARSATLERRRIRRHPNYSKPELSARSGEVRKASRSVKRASASSPKPELTSKKAINSIPDSAYTLSRTKQSAVIRPKTQ